MNIPDFEGVPQQPSIELTPAQLELVEDFKEQLKLLNNPEFRIKNLLTGPALASGFHIDRMSELYENGIGVEDTKELNDRRHAFKQAALLGMSLGDWLFPEVAMTPTVVHRTIESMLGYTKDTKLQVEEKIETVVFRAITIGETISSDFTTARVMTDAITTIPTDRYGDGANEGALKAGFLFGMYLYERAELARKEMLPVGEDWDSGLAELTDPEI